MGSSLRWGPCHSLHLKPLPFCRKRGPDVYKRQTLFSDRRPTNSVTKPDYKRSNRAKAVR